jgi:hypothetical protein
MNIQKMISERQKNRYGLNSTLIILKNRIGKLLKGSPHLSPKRHGKKWRRCWINRNRRNDGGGISGGGIFCLLLLYRIRTLVSFK